ncbi:MAG: M48 family metalloprotease [Pseudorhodoplanes sp.]|jgi:predicted Zn-dependent protease|nr:M48 family metalloprotease [Pseudorhodoplanes sp.]
MTAVDFPIRTRRLRPASRAVSVFTAAALAATSLPQPAAAQGNMPVIRDTEIEQLLRDYTQPILRTAGLSNQNIKVVIINNRAFNAFVMDGKRIFVNTGALMESETPNQIIGVLAHETGHIAGGHLSRLRDELANAQTMAIIGMLLGIGAIVAGGGGSGAGQAGAAAIAGSQHAALRTVLSYQRSQEEQADRAAVKFLNATGQSAKGMYDTFKRMADQMMFTARHADPYAQSHPMPAERVAALTQIAKDSKFWDKKDPAELQLRHDMMRAKISGFMEPPATVMRRYPQNDSSLPARYARAISTYKHGNLQTAVQHIDALIAQHPSNPYFHELKGQALMESGRAAEAVAPLRRAVQMVPNAPLIQIMLGQALVGTNNPANADEAVNMLRNALAREPEAPAGYQQLAMAYGRKGDLAQADLASAQAAFYRGDIKTARELAARAKTRFPVGTPGWVKADDIVSTKLPESAQMRRR